MKAGWSAILNEAQALLALEAMEIQVALALAAAIVFIMFFEGIWAVFNLPRRPVISLLRPSKSQSFEQAATAFADTPRFGFAAGAKWKPGRDIIRNRKRAIRVRRRFKHTKPMILKNTRIEPWLLAEPQLETPAPLRHPDAV